MKLKIKKRIADIRTATKEVYTKPFYLILSIIIALILVTFNIGIINYRLYFSFPSFEVVWKVFLGTFSTLPIHSIILLFIASILTGILISLLTYHIKSMRGSGMLSKSSSSGFVGMVLGIVAPACASCGIGLIALLGFTGLLGSLPFAGLEVGLAGVLLLGIAITSLSTKISAKTCEVKEGYFSRLVNKRKEDE